MFSITENNWYHEQTAVCIGHIKASKGGVQVREREDKREDTVKYPRFFPSRFLLFTYKNKQFSKYSSTKRK